MATISYFLFGVVDKEKLPKVIRVLGSALIGILFILILPATLSNLSSDLRYSMQSWVERLGYSSDIAIPHENQGIAPKTPTIIIDPKRFRILPAVASERGQPGDALVYIGRKNPNILFNCLYDAGLIGVFFRSDEGWTDQVASFSQFLAEEFILGSFVFEDSTSVQIGFRISYSPMNDGTIELNSGLTPTSGQSQMVDLVLRKALEEEQDFELMLGTLDRVLFRSAPYDAVGSLDPWRHVNRNIKLRENEQFLSSVCEAYQTQ